MANELNIDAERVAFEAWARESRLMAEKFGVLSVSVHCKTAWLAWQARASQAPAPSPAKYKLSDDERQALAKAAETGATFAEMPGGSIMFINRGEDYGDRADLDCPHCGGSGHKDDGAPSPDAGASIDEDEFVESLVTRFCEKGTRGYENYYARLHAWADARLASQSASAKDAAGWISVADLLPTIANNEYVWASWTGAGDWQHEAKQGLARYIAGMGWQPMGSMGWDWDVTDWQPLPAAPARAAMTKADHG
ncbi:MAG: DUF551 domain-containing protein [Pseudomonadota bacterium]